MRFSVRPAVITMSNLPCEENLNKWHWNSVKLVVIIHHMQTSAHITFCGEDWQMAICSLVMRTSDQIWQSHCPFCQLARVTKFSIRTWRGKDKTCRLWLWFNKPFVLGGDQSYEMSVAYVWSKSWTWWSGTNGDLGTFHFNLYQWSSTSTTVRWETTRPGTFAAGAIGENYFTTSCAISPRNLSLGSRGYNKEHCEVD